jgi:hypothetical protein
MGMENARAVCAKILGADFEQVIFNSGATEGISTVFNSILSKEKNKKIIIISGIEHSAIINTAHFYETLGFIVKLLPVNADGIVDVGALSTWIKDNPNNIAMVAVMAANNETGVIQPYVEINSLCLKNNIPYLCDTTQYIGKTPFDFKELNITLPYKQPLKMHARYTRDQILAAFGLSSFYRKSPSREGVAENQDLNTELLFINLIKSEEKFSPTTMYDDYAVNEILFHWQSQNSARPEKGKGLSYVQQRQNNKIILLFVREKATDEIGNTMGYVFIGEGTIKDHYGSKPMSINWELKEPIPHYLYKDSAKLSLG